MQGFSRAQVPQHVLDALEPIKDNDEAVKAYGIHLGTEMCKTLIAAGTKHLHLYTLNLEKTVMAILTVRVATFRVLNLEAFHVYTARSIRRFACDCGAGVRYNHLD